MSAVLDTEKVYGIIRCDGVFYPVVALYDIDGLLIDEPRWAVWAYIRREDGLFSFDLDECGMGPMQ